MLKSKKKKIINISMKTYTWNVIVSLTEPSVPSRRDHLGIWSPGIKVIRVLHPPPVQMV